MVVPMAKTIEELVERMKGALPPTRDDVTVLADGLRLDSREVVMAWLKEDAIARQAGAS
jgi:hypothetical protein